MGGNHPHHHHDHARASERRIFAVMLLTAGFMVVEVLGGLWSGSLALLADAGHMATDAGALLLAWMGFIAGRRQADPQRTYGYRRFEVLAAWVNGVVLIALTIWIAVEAVARMWEPQPVAGLPMLAVAAVGLLVNLVALYVLHGSAEDNLNLRGAALHVLGDLLGSVGAIAGALIILWTNWTPIDPILSLLVSLLILRSAWSLVKQSTHILLEGAPEGLDVPAMTREMAQSLEEIEDIHHVHAWSLTSGEPLVTLHVKVAEGADQNRVLRHIKNRLSQEFHLKHSVIQIEHADCPDRGDHIA